MSPAPAPAAQSVEVVAELGSRLVLQRDVGDAATLCARSVLRMLSAERAYCQVAEPDGESLRSWGAAQRDGGPGEVARPSTQAGLSGRVIQQGESVAAAAAAEGDGSGFVPAVDDAAGDGAVHWLGVPVPGPASRPIAVLVAVRAADAAPFDSWDASRLRLVAEVAAPALADLVAEQGEERSVFDEQIARGRPLHLFRHQALEQHASGVWRDGDPLELGAAWHEWAYWLLVAALVAAAVLAVAVHLPVRARAAAVIVEPSGAAGDVAGLRARALVPANFGEVDRGAPARLRVLGAERTMPLTVLEVVGRAETAAAGRRWLGGAPAGEPGPPPYRLVELVGPRPVDGERLAAGTPVTVEMTVGEQPLLLAVFPGLRRLVEDSE
jgi:hypothetical protein